MYEYLYDVHVISVKILTHIYFLCTGRFPQASVYSVAVDVKVPARTILTTCRTPFSYTHE